MISAGENTTSLTVRLDGKNYYVNSNDGDTYFDFSGGIDNIVVSEKENQKPRILSRQEGQKFLDTFALSSDLSYAINFLQNRINNAAKLWRALDPASKAEKVSPDVITANFCSGEITPPSCKESVTAKLLASKYTPKGLGQLALEHFNLGNEQIKDYWKMDTDERLKETFLKPDDWISTAKVHFETALFLFRVAFDSRANLFENSAAALVASYNEDVERNNQTVKAALDGLKPTFDETVELMSNLRPLYNGWNVPDVIRGQMENIFTDPDTGKIVLPFTEESDFKKTKKFIEGEGWKKLKDKVADLRQQLNAFQTTYPQLSQQLLKVRARDESSVTYCDASGFMKADFWNKPWQIAWVNDKKEIQESLPASVNALAAR